MLLLGLLFNPKRQALPNPRRILQAEFNQKLYSTMGLNVFDRIQVLTHVTKLSIIKQSLEFINRFTLNWRSVKVSGKVSSMEIQSFVVSLQNRLEFA